MKTYTKLFLIALLVFVTAGHLSGQNIGDLHGISYQAVAIDDDGKEIVGLDMEGKPLYEKEIGVRFTIQKGNDGDVLYQETHTALTDQHGLFSLTIGKGNQTGGEYNHLNDIPWIDADQWLRVEISIENDGNYRVVSNQQFMTVPYSFYTDNIADNAITTAKILNYTIQNEDIADETINLKEKVTDTLPVENGGTGRDSVPGNSLLVGNGINSLDTINVTDSIMVLTNREGDNNPKLYKLRAGPRTGLSVDTSTNTVSISADKQGGGPGTATKSVSISNIQSGNQQTRAIELPGIEMNDIILPSVEVDLQGLTMTAYVSEPDWVTVVFYNGSTSEVNFTGAIDITVANFGKP